jgi:hypothetical protein
MMGWHGNRRAWAIRKMDELDALNITIRRLLEDGIPIEKNNEDI